MGVMAPGAIETLRPVINEPEVHIEKTPLGGTEALSWWKRYEISISGLPEDTRTVVETDARYIAMHAVPIQGDGIDINAFGPERVRTGIVVGSVQSGKTASMLGVAALLLDSNVDILVILAGTRVALWLQTYERLLNQLDGSDLLNAWGRNAVRVLVPQPEDILSSEERVDPFRYLRGARLKVKAALRAKKPVIFVVPKEDDHLLALAKFLSEHTELSLAEERSRPFNLVVLDDEADDASILDARDGHRITPQFIQYLWSSEVSAPATRHDKLFATYIAYTATPQANYLQRSHNPLAPRSFHAALRVPSDTGERAPRSVTYSERKGLKGYYCGGEIYYERLRGQLGDFCVAQPFPTPIDGESPDDFIARHEAIRWQMIGDALRSYFVGGAVRLHLSGLRLSIVPVEPVSLAELKELLPATHSMLYHPSALKEKHFVGAEDIVRWSAAIPGFESDVQLPNDEFGDSLLCLDVDGLIRRLDLEEDKWRRCLSTFSDTAAGLASLPGGTDFSIGAINWEEIKELLLSEVFPSVRLRVLNSDPRADDRPIFEPTVADASGLLWNAPRDIYTIFVAGNVLSRGLTVEGLSTSLFLRGAREPAADTQMQMQRWFGYRGSYLAFCRVFLFEDQLQLFRQYHRNDIALKSEILSHMDGYETPFGSGVLVLQGNTFSATAKVDSRRVPLHPGATPAIRLVEPSFGRYYENNLQLVEGLMSDGDWQVLGFPDGVERGLIRTEPISMLNVAEFLDQLRYSCHDPDIDLEISQRWVSLQRMMNLSQPLFRPPRETPGLMMVDPSGCPFSIAAYLRLWNEALKRHDLPGMQPTDNPAMPWNMLNLSKYRSAEPKFYVGVRFGSEGLSERLSFRGRKIPMMRRGIMDSKSYLLETLWGSRNPTERWRGDQFFDYHFHDPKAAPRLLQDGAWRARGQPGLLLIHPVVEPVTGKVLIAMGLAMPHGGPDHVAALRIGSDI